MLLLDKKYEQRNTSIHQEYAESEKEPEDLIIEIPENNSSGLKTESEDEYKESTFTENTNGILQYWLYSPSHPAENMPLIVYLHGGSSKGEDLNLLTSVDGFPKYLQNGELGDVGAYVLMPQCPSSKKGWIELNRELDELIQFVVEEFKIDKKKISLTGHSMGGTGVWNLAAAYPQLFSRIAPLSGSVRDASKEADILQDIPVWAFVGADDTIVSPEISEEIVAEMKEDGGNSKITVFNGADHFEVPKLAYLNESLGLIDWLIE